MLRIYFFVTFVALTAVALAEEPIGNIDVKMAKKFGEFRTDNTVVKLTPVVMQLEGQFHYRFGRFVDGDRLIAQEQNSSIFPDPQAFQMKLVYPKTGMGSIVSYVEIVSNQSSNVAAAYVISGGIGLRRITILVEAKDTLYFSFIANIFGY